MSPQGALLACAALLASCGGRPTDDDRNVVNLYTWTNYLAPDTLSGFTAQTGIKVRVSYFDSDETLEGRLLTGHSGFDVVVPTANMLAREVRSDTLLALDKASLPNLKNLDPALMRQLAASDPGNRHVVDYTFGTVGIGYDRARQHTPIESWAALFDPDIAKDMAHCGISVIDSPTEMIRLALIYLHHDPDAPSEADLAQVETLLLRVRPMIRLIASDAVEPLANGDVCMAVAYNGGVIQSRNRAREAKNGVDIDFVVPKEGSLLWADLLAIPRDAPHPANAHRLINYLMDPKVIAAVSNATGYANGNLASRPFIDAKLLKDPASFPTAGMLEHLHLEAEDSAQRLRAYTRIWQRFKTGA